MVLKDANLYPVSSRYILKASDPLLSLTFHLMCVKVCWCKAITAVAGFVKHVLTVFLNLPYLQIHRFVYVSPERDYHTQWAA